MHLCQPCAVCCHAVTFDMDWCNTDVSLFLFRARHATYLCKFGPVRRFQSRWLLQASGPCNQQAQKQRTRLGRGDNVKCFMWKGAGNQNERMRFFKQPFFSKAQVVCRIYPTWMPIQNHIARNRWEAAEQQQDAYDLKRGFEIPGCRCAESKRAGIIIPAGSMPVLYSRFVGFLTLSQFQNVYSITPYSFGHSFTFFMGRRPHHASPWQGATLSTCCHLPAK